MSSLLPCCINLGNELTCVDPVNSMISSSLADMELRYNKSLERTALLEEELVEKSKLEEENQRLKDELRGEWASVHLTSKGPLF